MDKKVLVLYYSQSGQLEKIARNFLSSIEKEGADIDWVKISPTQDFPFPWTGKAFFNAMPESVLGIPMSITEPSFKHEKYDLVVFAYQPWFLSPSIPATSALLNSKCMSRLKNTPVIVLIGARNMWLSSQEKIKTLLRSAESKLVGTIVFTDKHQNLISAITIQYWMFTGKKDRMWGVLPLPGVSDKDIQSATNIGMTLKEYLNHGIWDGLQAKLVEQGEMTVKPTLMFVESRATMLFSIWANTIIKKRNREAWLKAFQYYLLIALFVVAPIVLFFYTIFILPITRRSISKKQKYYLGLS